MMFKLIISCLMICAFMGCASNPWMENYRVAPIVKGARLPAKAGMYTKTHQLNTDSLEFEKIYKDAKKKKGSRDEIIVRMLLISDDAYSIHRANVQANSATFNLATGVTSSALLGMGTVMTGSVTGALSAGATFANTINQLGNKGIFYEQVTISIFKLIDDERAKKRIEIMANMKKSIDEYTVDVAILQVNEYHRMGSLISGLTMLVGKE